MFQVFKMSLTFLMLIFIGLHCFYFVSGQGPMISFLITVPSESLNQVIFEGDVAVIRCSVLELPRNAVNVGISIRHNGQTVPSMMEPPHSASVTFFSVSTGDGGQYECIVSFTIQPGVVMTLPTKTVSLMVYATSSSPVCVHDKSQTTVHVGDEVQLSCYFKFNSDDTPTYQWQRLGDDSSILSSTVNNLSGKTGVLQTVIGPLQMAQNNTHFLCHNTMDSGNSRCTVVIDVQNMRPTVEATVEMNSPKVVNDTSTIAASMETVTSLAGTGSSQPSSVLLYVGIGVVLSLICVVVAVIVMYMFRSKRHVDKPKPHRGNIDHVYDNPVMQNLPPVENCNQPMTEWTSQSNGFIEPVKFVDNVGKNKDDIIVSFAQKSNERISPLGTKEASGTKGEKGAHCINDTSPENGGEIYNVIDEMYVDMSDSFKRGTLISDLGKDLMGRGNNEDDTSKYETFPSKAKEETSGQRRNTYMIYEESDETGKNNQGKDDCADKVEYTDMGNFPLGICGETNSVSIGGEMEEDGDITVTGMPKTAEDLGHLYTTVNKTRRISADDHIGHPRVDPIASSGNVVATDDIPITGNRVSPAGEDFSHLYSAVHKKTGKEVDSYNDIGAGALEVGFAHPRFIEISPLNSEDGLEEDFSYLYTAIDKTKHTKPELSDDKDSKEQDFSELYSQIEKKPHKRK